MTLRVAIHRATVAPLTAALAVGAVATGVVAGPLAAAAAPATASGAAHTYDAPRGSRRRTPWNFDPGANTWLVDNVLVRVPFPKGAW